MPCAMGDHTSGLASAPPQHSEHLSPIRVSAIAIMALAILGVAFITYYLPHVMRSAAIDTAIQANIETIRQIKEMRGYYTQQIITRAIETKALKPSWNHAGKPDEIPLPATLVKELSEILRKRDTTLALVSPYPWPHRASRKMDAFEQEAWNKFQKDPDAVFTRQEEVDGQRVLRVAVSDRMASQTCVNCHNADPDSVKHDWKLGDVRAVFQVTRLIEPHLAAAEQRGRYVVGMLWIGAALACGALGFVFYLFQIKSREKQQADHTAYYYAEHDGLTGLRNRACLMRGLNGCFEPGAVRPKYAALFLIDLDQFKPVNDTHGHGVGDRLLVAVSKRLRQHARGGDLIARLGGDEFAMAKVGPLSKERIAQDAEALCKAMSEPFQIDGHTLKIGASIGTAVIGVDAANTTDLMVAADLALYAAKGAGRSRSCPFEPEMTASALRRMRLEEDMRNALRRGEFVLHYQPIVSATTGKIVKLEALIRWNHPERGMLPPSEFIPLAEETGLIVPMGAWIVRAACRQIARLRGDYRVSINLSTVQLNRDTLLPALKRALEETRLDPTRLEVEITESVMIDNNAATVALLNDIRELGIEISIDDFGTGYSCLSYLQSYPVNCIKIDRSFVRPLGQQASAKSIVGAIIALSHALGMTTVAEGVETAEQLAELKNLGCDQVQGFYLARPKPLDEIELNKDLVTPASVTVAA